MKFPVPAALFICALVHPGGPVSAQEADLAAQKENSTEGAPRFFRTPIDYWQRGIRYGEGASGEGKTIQQPRDERALPRPPSDWAEVVTLPDGSQAVHELPKPLVTVLEDPSPDNIRAYFQWRLTRADKILRALERMKAFRSSEAGSGSGEEGSAFWSTPEIKAAEGLPLSASTGRPVPSGETPPGPFTVQYFHKQGCPHCDRQDAILAEWLKANPSGTLEVVEFGSHPELWRAFGVRGTPSLALLGRKAVFLEGVSNRESLDRALAEVRRGDAPKTAGHGGTAP